MFFLHLKLLTLTLTMLFFKDFLKIQLTLLVQITFAYIAENLVAFTSKLLFKYKLYLKYPDNIQSSCHIILPTEDKFYT